MLTKIQFKSLYIEGFGSYVEPLTFEIQNGIFIIKGRNGAGKTTLFSALSWCLYGKPLKGIKGSEVGTWEHLRTDKWQGTKVSVLLNVNETDYEIIRHIDYKGQTYGNRGGNSLIILKDGLVLSSELYKTDQQDYIEKLLGMSFKVFLNTVLFGQKMTRLINATNEQKRELLEEMFDLEYLDKLKTVATVKHKNLKSEVAIIQTQLDDELKNLKKLNLSRDETQKSIDEQNVLVVKLSQDINYYTDTINATQSEIATLINNKAAIQSNFERDKDAIEHVTLLIANKNKEIIDYKSKFDSNNTLIIQLTSTLHSLSAKRGELNKRLFVLKNNLSELTHARCSECNSIINEQQILELKDKYEREVESIYSSLQSFDYENTTIENEQSDKINKSKSYEQILTQLNNEYRELEQQKNAIASSTIDLSGITATIQSLEKNIELLHRSLNSARDQQKAFSIERLSQKLIDTDFSIKTISDNVEQLQTALSDYSYKLSLYEWWNTVGFSTKGLSTYVFNLALETLNTLIQKYADQVGVGIRFSVDLTKVSRPFLTHVLKDNKVVNYECLSGGEKQRIDICLAFALHDLYSSNTTNLLILDEVFESIDDYGGIEEVMQLIQFKSGVDKGVYIITHNQTLLIPNSLELFVDKTQTTFIN